MPTCIWAKEQTEKSGVSYALSGRGYEVSMGHRVIMSDSGPHASVWVIDQSKVRPGVLVDQRSPTSAESVTLHVSSRLV